MSASGFYEWATATLSVRARRRELVTAHVRDAFTAGGAPTGTAGSTPILADWGVACGLELVRDLMRELGLEPCQPRPGGTR